MDDQKLTLREWLGFTERFEFENAKGLGRFLGFLIALIALVLAIALFAALVRIVASVFSPDEVSIRDLGYVIIGAIGIPFAAWRTIVAQRQAKVAEQGHITDRISKAVEQLGAEKTIKKDDREQTVPNLEVRIGGLLALERIKDDSPRDHIQVMEILCSYVRENMRQITAESGIPEKGNYHEFREDIATLFKIIDRRRETQREYEKRLLGAPILDFSNTSFVGHNLSNIDFSEANLSGSDLSSTLCTHTSFKMAKLHSCKFENAALYFPNFSHSECISCRFMSCDIRRAEFFEAECTNMDILGGDFSASYLTRTNLRHARLFPDNPLTFNFFEHANLVDAQVASTISQGQLDSCFGEYGMDIPKTLHLPDHWLDGEEFVDTTFEWKKWIEEGDAYIPPHLRDKQQTK